MPHASHNVKVSASHSVANRGKYFAQEEASAAEVLELLHHADSCDLDKLPPQGPTFTGESFPM